MEEFRTPIGQRLRSFNRTPKYAKARRISLNVQCSTPISNKLHSPNLSPIENIGKLTASPSICKKLFKQKQSISSLKPSDAKLEDFNTSLDALQQLDEVESELCKESRRRSLMATRHTHVINNASSVRDVLVLVGLEGYVDTFEKAHIDLVELVSMERKDLNRLGVRKNVDCERILIALRDL